MIASILVLAQLPTARIEIDPARVLNRVTDAMYGSCIEDVNHEIYGGLYGQLIFGESFEEPPTGAVPHGWKAYGGQWYPDGTGIHVRGGPGPKLVGPELGDGTFEAELAPSNDMGENAGFLVRVSNAAEGADAFDGYEISLGARDRRLILGKHRHDFRSIQSVPAPIVPGRWHRLQVQLSGPRIQVFLDAETTPRIDFTDPDRPFLTGAVALRTWHSNVSFRNLLLNGNPVSVSLASPGVSRMWDAVGKGDFAVEQGAYNGTYCQKVVAHTGFAGVANRGLNRWGISTTKGRAMEGRVYLRGNVGEATVSLQSQDGSRVYASQKLAVGDPWGKAPFRLVPNTTDPKARFVVGSDKPGSLCIDQAVLVNGDRFAGLPIRGDIGRMMQAEGLKFVRYGGTMVNVPGYRWKSMIGDPDKRPPYVGHWYPSSTNGFGIFDFLRFCEAAKFGAAFAINAEETPEDAADLADYLTAPTSNPWGKKRAEDGHPAPYRPEYIEIGNEEAIGNQNEAAMIHYAERFQLLATAIHRRNPSLKLVCAAWWDANNPAMEKVFRAVETQAAAWDLHFWSDDPNAGTSIDRDLDLVQTKFKVWNPNTKLKAVVFEENGGLHDERRAMGHATTLNATRRHGDFVLADCAANGLQPFRQNDNGWDQGQIFFTPDKVWGTPPFEAHQQISRDHLPLRVAAKVTGPIDAIALRSEDGKKVSVTVVNTGFYDVTVTITGFRDQTVVVPARSVKSVQLK